MREKLTEWIFIVISGLLLPCVVTILYTGVPSAGVKEASGIKIHMEQGKTVDMEEFLIYMIAGEIDLNCCEEALKAQAVIARTNLMRELNGKKEASAKNLEVSYLTREKLEGSLGEVKLMQLTKKIERAVKSTEGEVLLYDGECIDALYHKVSIGNTVSSEEVFGLKRPYLVEADSSQDVESEDYMTVTEWKAEEVLERLRSVKKAEKTEVSRLLEEISIKEKTKHGYIKEVAIGKETLTGIKWQELFLLPSANFYLEEEEGMLRIITLGKGHGVGLSQYGANTLAKEGASYERILKNYYTDVTLEKIKIEE